MGFFDNMYIVGKAYMFEICDNKRMRITGFTFKAVLMIMGVYCGPWIGLKIYDKNH